jgi:hypothetical protein
LVAGIVAGSVGCGDNRTISVRDLERAPAHYEGQVVSVDGCYHNGPEATLLQPCAEPKPDEVVWVVFRSQLENTAKSVPGYATGSTKYERPSAKEDALAQQLSNLPNGVFSEVRLRGEFQSSSGRVFGTSPGYRHQLVVHRVVSVSPGRQPR